MSELKEKKLKDMNVAVFESRHAKTLCDLIRLSGGNAVSAPSLKEVPLENNPQVFSFAEKLFAGEIDLLILLTGVGARALLSVLETRYPKEQILEAFRKIKIVPRGPKPVRVLNEWQVPYAFTVPEPNTWVELLETLSQNKAMISLQGCRVAVQEYGVENTELLEGLKHRGAQVLKVPVYRWELPDDLEPLKTTIEDMIAGNIQVALFTTAVQVTHLFQVAKQMGLETLLERAFSNLVVASVGPDCSKAIAAYGIRVDIEPESPKMGPLVQGVAEKAKLIFESKKKAGTSLEKSCATEVLDTVLRITRDESWDETPFIKACRLQKTSFTPVWLMRQAGRYMTDYRQIREKHAFLDICKNKDLVTEITVTAQEKIHADAAIIFSDILLMAEAFGLGLDYLKGDGPSIKKAIRSKEDVQALPQINPEESLSYVMQAIRQTRQSLKPNIPLIGFAGAPFTLASYMIEGGSSKDFERTKKLMHSDTGIWEDLMEKITRATAKYLNAQVKAGVQAVQLFDSWAGCLSAEEYERYVYPYSSRLIASVDKRVPLIHFGTGTGKFIGLFSRAGGDVIGVDHRISIGDAWKKIGYDKAVQGNLDPTILVKGSLKDIEKGVRAIFHEVGSRPGHIFNLGHGVLLETPLENVIALVDMVHEFSR